MTCLKYDTNMLGHRLLNLAVMLLSVCVKDRDLENVYVCVYDLNLYISGRQCLYVFDAGVSMRIYVKGFGCSSSVADAEVLAGCLLSAGHTLVSDLDGAELVVYNTCAVKAPTEDRMINLLKETPREKKLVVGGCLPLINLERLRREVRFDAVVGPASGREIVDVVRSVWSGVQRLRLEENAVEMPGLGLPHVRVNPEVSIVPISYGCLGACAYCCVRFARGQLRSYSVKDVVERVERDVGEGVHEFWLTCQDTACYGRDIGTNLAELLRSVCGVGGDFFVRVGMMTPNNFLEISRELVDAFRSEKVFKFLHLPVQSGDDAVLRRMNRLYSTTDFVTIVEEFKKAFPRSTVATDVIVGFPGETREAFDRTCVLVESVRPDIVNVSKFFARPGTAAVDLKPKVSPSVIKRRSALLAGLVRGVALQRNGEWNGWAGRILVDEVGKPGSVVGRNFAYKPVVIRGSCGRGLLGRFVSVRVTGVFQSYLLGEVV